MPNPYFSNLGDFLYVNRTREGRGEGDYSLVKNLFKRAKLREDIYQDLTFFTKYDVLGDDRPDYVADFHHYESREVKASDGTIIIPSGSRVSVGQSVSFYDEISDQQVIRTDVAMPITNYMHEDRLNNEKRSIFLLKPIYLNILFSNKEIIDFIFLSLVINSL